MVLVFCLVLYVFKGGLLGALCHYFMKKYLAVLWIINTDEAFHIVTSDFSRGAFHLFEMAYEILSTQKDFYRFFLKTIGFLPKLYEISGSEMPLDFSSFVFLRSCLLFLKMV